MSTTPEPPPCCIRDWLDSDGRPANLYQLLGRPWFDLDKAALAEAIRTAYGDLLPYQNHRDRKVAARAVQLQKELGRAESILSDPKRLSAHHQEMVESLRKKYDAASEEADQYWDAAQAESWLVEHQGVHPQAAAAVARSLTSRGKAVVEFAPPKLPEAPSASGRGQDASGLADKAGKKPKSLVRRLIAAANSGVEVFGVSLSGGLFVVLVMLLGAAIAITIMAPWREVEEKKGSMPPTTQSHAPPDTKMPESQPQPRPQPSSAPAPAMEREELIQPGLGKTFEGRLAQIRGHAGEIHLLIVDLIGPRNRWLEAFTGVEGFARELKDYRTDEEVASQGGDAVVVEVVGLDPAQPVSKFRLCSWWDGTEVPLVELRSIAKKDNPASRAVGGSRRPDESFAADRQLSGLAGLLRIHPPEGSTVRLIGTLDIAKSDSSQLTVKPREPRSEEKFACRRRDGNYEEYRRGTGARLLRPAGADAAVLQQARVVLVEAVAHPGGDAAQLEMTLVRCGSLLSDVQHLAWQEAYSRPDRCVGQEVQLLGIYDGKSSGGATIRVRPFVRTSQKDEPVEIAYSTAGATGRLTWLKPGAEILCGVRVRGGEPERPQLALVWVAKDLDPQNRVPFAAPATP